MSHRWVVPGAKYHVLACISGVESGGLHLCTERLELCQRDIRRTAFSAGLCISLRVIWCKWLRTLLRKIGREDVCRVVEVTVRMPAYQLSVARKADIALDDP